MASFLDKAKAAAADLTAQAKKATRPKHTYKLTYFNLRGLAEIARLLFAVGEEQYEDDRILFEMKPDGSFDRGNFEERRAANEFVFAKVPQLTIDGKTKIAQSKAIERYLARRYELMGANDMEAAEIDMYGEQLIDLRMGFVRAQAQDAVAKELNHTFAAGESHTEKFWATGFGEQVALLESVLAKSGAKEHFVGGKLSLADIQLFVVLSSMQNQDAVTKALAAAPILSAIQKKVAEHPKIAEWVAKRPQTMF